MNRHQQSDNQRLTSNNANRISTLQQQGVLDRLFYRLLEDGTDRLAEDESGYFVNDCLVSHISGDRSTGVTFEIADGVGLRFFGSLEPDDDLPEFKPIEVTGTPQFVTDNSDGSNPRLDRVFMTVLEVDENQDTVDIINPATKNITQELRFLDKRYSFQFVYVAGTPAVTPVAPSAPGGFTDEDAIAEILMLPGSGAFDPNDLTDLRTVFAFPTVMTPAVSTLPASSITTVGPLTGPDVQTELEALNTAVAALSGDEGLLLAEFQPLSTGSVRLARTYKGEIKVEIDGVVITQSGSDIDFEFPGDLDIGVEAPSTMYYCYLRVVGASLVEQISVTPPVIVPGSGKVGYHPTNTTWRWVGSFYNMSDSNIMPFDRIGNMTLIREFDASVDSSFLLDLLSAGNPTTYTAQSVASQTPVTATAVLLDIALETDSRLFGYGEASLLGKSAESGGFLRAPNRCGAWGGSNKSLNIQCEIGIKSSRQFAFAARDTSGLQGPTEEHFVNIIGWRERLLALD